MYFDSLPDHPPRQRGVLAKIQSTLNEATSAVFSRLPKNFQRKFNHNPRSFVVQAAGVALIVVAVAAVPLLAYQVSIGDFDTRQQAYTAQEGAGSATTTQKSGGLKPGTDQTTNTGTSVLKPPGAVSQPAVAQPTSGNVPGSTTNPKPAIAQPTSGNSVGSTATETNPKSMTQNQTGTNTGSTASNQNSGVGGAAASVVDKLKPTPKQKCVAKLGSQARYTEEKLKCQLKKNDWSDGLCTCQTEEVPSIADVVSSVSTKPPGTSSQAGKPPGTTTTNNTTTDTSSSNTTTGTSASGTGSFSGTVLVCVNGEDYIKGLAENASNVDGVGTSSFCVQVASSYTPNQIRDICRNTWAADGSYYRNNGLISSPSACDTDLIIRSGTSGWGVVSATTNNASKPISQSTAISNPAATVDYFQTVNRVEELVAITEKNDGCTTQKCQTELRAAQAEIDKLANQTCAASDQVCALRRESARTASEIARQNAVEQQARIAAETTKKDQTELATRLNEAINRNNNSSIGDAITDANTRANNEELAANLRDQLNQKKEPSSEVREVINNELVDPTISLELREELYERDCTSLEAAVNDSYCASLGSSITDKRREVDRSRTDWLSETQLVLAGLRVKGTALDLSRAEALYTDYCQTGIAAIDDSDICTDFKKLLDQNEVADTPPSDTAAGSTQTGADQTSENDDDTQGNRFNLGQVLSNLASSVLKPVVSVNESGQSCTKYFIIFTFCEAAQPPVEEPAPVDAEAESTGNAEAGNVAVLLASDFTVIHSSGGAVTDANISNLRVCYKVNDCQLLTGMLTLEEQAFTKLLSWTVVERANQLYLVVRLDNPTTPTNESYEANIRLASYFN